MKRGKLFIKCLVKGENSFSLIEKLHKSGVYTRDITFLPQKTLFSVDFADRKKLFAISRNMCYNIHILKYYGKISPVKKVLSRLGLAVCFAFFTAFTFFIDGYVGKIVYKGDGEYLAPEISALLSSEGVRENSFLKVDLKSVEKAIVKNVNSIAYVSVSKSGRVVTVEAYLAEKEPTSMNVKKPNITATCSGKVTALNVLSGTACVGVGDSVQEGDVLIDGYYLNGEEKVLTYALGEIEILVTYVYEYQSFASGAKYKNRAVLLAKESLGDKNVIKTEIKEENKNGKTVYTVELYYLITVS